MAPLLTITFPINPPFILDFSPYARQDVKLEPKNLSVRGDVKTVGIAVIKNVGFFFVAIAKASYSTGSNAGTSFKHIVLGYYGDLRVFRPTVNIYLVAFKVIVWVASMGWCIIATTARFIYQKNLDPVFNQNLLNCFSDPEINVAHIKTNESAIDTSAIPEKVIIDHLLPIFDQIDFNDPQSLYYMAPGSRQEYGVPDTPSDLKKSLGKFVDNVKGRVPFLGTPPAYDTPRLMAFYQQIENATRFSLHKVSTKYELAKGNYDRFMIEQNNQIPAENDLAHQEYVSLKNSYKNTFEDQARLAINLAMAGKHCGARYMGESMELYDAHNGEVSLGQATLEEAIVEILAAKRKEIARAEIQLHLGSGTHAYNNYLSSLGSILAIPGTENVIEHLSSQLSRPRYLKFFFKKYTVDCIISAINEKIKSSQIFREKIIDWLRDHSGDWNTQIDGNALAQLLSELNPILAREQVSEDYPLYLRFLSLQSLIFHLKEQKIPFPMVGNNWDEFIAELFILDSAKEWLGVNSKGGTPIEKARLKDAIKSLFAENQLGPQLVQKVTETIERDSPLQVGDFSEKLLLLQKISLLSPHMNQSVALRVIQGQKELTDAILEHKEQGRGLDFIEQLIDPEKLVAEGLSVKLMEWILVSQNILCVQTR
jgi:hypothetical protein